jgi:D-alanyl-D-alanine dipeptidase
MSDILKRLLGTCLIFAFIFLGAKAQGGLSEDLRGRTDLVAVPEGPSLAIQLRYASSNNFMAENLYGSFNTLFMHKNAYKKLLVAESELARLKPGWKLLIFDALRPRSVQRKMWARVVGTPKEVYVANPDHGSVHNFGMAIDLSLMDEKGAEVDMGTPFDSFERIAQPRYESEFLKNAKLSSAQVENRKLLRKTMTAAGFINIQNEWWHFDALPQKEVRAHYQIIEGDK